MTQESVKTFLEKVKSDEALLEKVKAACSTTGDELLTKAVALAKEHGYDVTVDDLKKAALTDSHCIPWGL